jgi:hypothetical protein
MVTSTPNLGLQKQAGSELVDEQIELNGNYDLVDNAFQPLVFPRYQKQFQDFSSLNGGLGYLMPTTETATPNFTVPTYDPTKTYRVRAICHTVGTAGGRFRQRLLLQTGQKQFMRYHNADRSNLPNYMVLPNRNGESGVANTDTVFYNYAPGQPNVLASKGWSQLGPKSVNAKIHPPGTVANNPTDWLWEAVGNGIMTNDFSFTMALSDAESPLVAGDHISVYVEHCQKAPDAHNINVSIDYINGSGSVIGTHNGTAQANGTSNVTFYNHSFPNVGTGIPVGTIMIRVSILDTMPISVTPGYITDSQLRNVIVCKGSTLPPAFFYWGTTATSTTDYMKDNVNADRSVSKIYSKVGDWAISRSSTETICVTEGILNPYPGGVADAKIAKFPVIYERERTQSPVYLKRAGFLMEAVS